MVSLRQAFVQIFAFGKAPLDLRPRGSPEGSPLGEELKAKQAFRAKRFLPPKRYAMLKGPKGAFLASPSAKSKGSCALGPAARRASGEGDPRALVGRGQAALASPLWGEFKGALAVCGKRTGAKRLRGKGCRR